MVFQQIDQRSARDDPDVDVGIGFEKLDHDRQDMQPAEHDRRGDDQVASRRAVFARRGALGFSDVFEDALAGRDVGSARIGQRQAPAGPVDEPSS